MVETIDEIRNLRDKGIWVRYDSILIGPGLGGGGAQGSGVPGWFNNFSGLAGAEELRFGDGSRTEGTAGATYCNQSGSTEDWAQKVFATRIEFIAPFGIEEFETNSFDAGFGPMWWLQEVPRRMSCVVSLADTDNIIKVPPIMMPSNLGVQGQSIGGSASTFAIPGQTGENNLTVGFLWPEPIEVPAKGKLFTTMRLGLPLRPFMLQLTGNTPGAKNVVITADQVSRIVRYPNIYGIRVSHWGPRFLQLRGARSS